MRGFKEMEAGLERLRQKASQVSHELQGFRLPEGGLTAGGVVNRNRSGNIQPVAAPGGSGLPHAPSSMSQRHRATFGRGQQYNLNTPSGVMEYYENVLAQSNPMIRGLQAGSIASRFGVKYQGYATSTTNTKPTNDQMYTWFTKLGSEITKMDQRTRNAYLQAITESANSRSAYPKPVQDFVNAYGAQLGAPRATTTTSVIPQSRGSRFAQHFTNNVSGKSIGGALGAGLKGAIGGSLIDMAAGGEAGALGAGMIGGTLGGPVGAIAAVGIQTLLGAAANTIGQGIKTFQATVPAFSALSHALDGATTHVNQFRYATQLAGARTAMTPEQSTQAAMTLAQAFGMSAGGLSGITGLVSQAGRFGLMNGISPTTMASMMSTAGALGITNGKGASMNSQSFNEMLLNMTQLSHMQGRQQSLYTGLLGVYSGLGSVNPIISSANSTAAIYTRMNATGIQGLQGQRGANLLTQMNSTLGSGHGLAGIMGLAAVYRASGGKISNPWQALSIEEQGLGAGIGKTTYGAQLQKMVQQMAPGNLYTQAGILSSIAGISVNQAMAMLQSGAMGAQHISTVNNSTQTMTASDRTTSASARIKVTASGLGYASNQLKALGAQAIGTPTTVGTNGMSGSIYATSSPSSTSSYAGPRYSSRGTSSGGGVNQWLPQMYAAAQKTGVPISVIRSIMMGESGGIATAGSLQHAYGLMQLEPAGQGGPAGATNAARLNPASNILVGAQYLKQLYNMFGHNWGLAAAAYFAGAGTIQAHVSPSQYQESLSQLSGQLNFTPPGNNISVEQYAANFEQNAAGNAVSQLSPLTTQHMMTRYGYSPSGESVINLSPQTMDELANKLAAALTKQLMLNGGKGPSH